MYSIIRTILFWFDAEKVHYFSMNRLRWLCQFGAVQRMMSKIFEPRNIPVTAFGLSFKNPVGLAAGFDKNAAYLAELAALGFSHVEIGTVTPLPQAGNDRPRLFRLPEDRALLNRMGFNNDGAAVVAENLKAFRAKFKATSLIIGGNIGKNKDTANENAHLDYEKCFRALHSHVDYFVVNVSSPNTPGLRALQEKDALTLILTHLQQINAQMAVPRPLLLKIAPDLTNEQLNDVVELSLAIKLDGLVVANTTISREALTDAGKIRAAEAGNGGISGVPVRQRSTEMLKYIAGLSQGKLPIIASGGVFTAADALEKLNAGAVLVQVWTGFVYEGPGIVKQICSKL